MLEGGKTILRMGRFELRMRHLLVIGVLALAFTTAFIMRSYPSKYGFYLNEFDPYFDYRATKYIVDHGLNAYFNWHDTMSWYPEGRNVPATSQSGLHIVAAFLYKIFGAGTSLLDFTILLPVVLGSLTTIVVFALVRTIGGTTAGMFSALLFAFSPAIIQRGNLGWFKSEPLGLFFGLLGVYLLLSALKHKEVKYSILKAIAGGFVLGLANASWGGVQYFSIPISIFFIALPFFRKDTTIPMYVAIAFTAITILIAGAFPRPGISFVVGLAGLALMGGTIFLIIAHFVKKLSQPRKAIRNTLFLLIAFVAVGVGVFAVGAYHHSSFRYLNAVNPFLSTQNQLVASVAEHFTPTLVDYFTNYSILLMFAGLGAWIAFRRRNDMSVFALILGLTGIYVSATFARLLVFASIGIIVLAGLGLYEITRTYLDRETSSPSAASSSFVATSKSKKVKKKNVEGSKILPIKSRWMIIAYVVLIVFMLCIPMVYPPNSNWLSSADIPPSIANGGTGYRLQTNDWINTLNWIAKDTPKNSVIAAWWDYGYWITTLGNKTSLADNATINQTRIATIAKMFIDQKENGIKIAHDLKADYILVYVVGQRFSGVNGTSFYTLGSGGDESKKQWFMRIGGFDETKYLQADGFTATPRFWNTTLLGSIIPFTPQAYASFQGGQLTNLQPDYRPGTVALYVKHIKFPVGSNPDNQPLSLVYSSPSFQSNDPGLVFGVLVYKVNHNYVPKITSNPYHEVFVNATQQPSQQQLKPLQMSSSSSHAIRSSLPSSGQGTPITNNATAAGAITKNTANTTTNATMHRNTTISGQGTPITNNATAAGAITKNTANTTTNATMHRNTTTLK
jgi:dolichyl-diphosphooligosaccharide---protein glycosyltransferase